MLVPYGSANELGNNADESGARNERDMFSTSRKHPYTRILRKGIIQRMVHKEDKLGNLPLTLVLDRIGRLNRVKESMIRMEVLRDLKANAHRQASAKNTGRSSTSALWRARLALVLEPSLATTGGLKFDEEPEEKKEDSIVKPPSSWGVHNAFHVTFVASVPMLKVLTITKLLNSMSIPFDIHTPKKRLQELLLSSEAYLHRDAIKYGAWVKEARGLVEADSYGVKQVRCSKSRRTRPVSMSRGVSKRRLMNKSLTRRFVRHSFYRRDLRSGSGAPKLTSFSA